jgi:hypothetical protein
MDPFFLDGSIPIHAGWVEYVVRMRIHGRTEK